MQTTYLRWLLALPFALLAATGFHGIAFWIHETFDESAYWQDGELAGPLFVAAILFTTGALFVYVGFLTAPAHQTTVATVLTLLSLAFSAAAIAYLDARSGKFGENLIAPIAFAAGAIVSGVASFRLVQLPFFRRSSPAEGSDVT